MRPTPWLLAEPYRIQTPMHGSRYGEPLGMFVIPFSRTGVELRCLAASGDVAQADFGPQFAWDHVSVSLKNRCPNWLEMSFVKTVFWGDDETVMQLHVPTSEHINTHPHVLHLWKSLLTAIPLPPALMV